MSMKGYPAAFIEQREIAYKLRTWQAEKTISDQQARELLAHYTNDLYQPNVFIKIGLFLFTCLACCFFAGLIVLIFSPAFTNSYESQTLFLSIILSISFAIALEYVIRVKHFVSVGIDNALLYACLLTIFYGINTLLVAYVSSTAMLLVMAIVALLATFRYGDSLVGGATLMLFAATLLSFLDGYELGKTLMPFVMMLFAAGVYGMIQYLKKRKDAFYYEACFDFLDVMSLLLFYLGGNYLIVREGNAMLHDIYTKPTPQIANAPLFYFFTLSIPFLYVLVGLNKRDRLMLGVGGIALAFSIFTYRYYFAVIPIEWALTLGGSALVGISLFFIRYLKVERDGFVDKEENSSLTQGLTEIAISHLVQDGLAKRPVKGEDGFGGGDFGGAGADGNY